MKIIVLVKEVPDTYGERKLTPQTGIARSRGERAVLDEIGERAIEVGAELQRFPQTPRSWCCRWGRTAATASVRKGLAMGADSAVHVRR